MKRKAPIAGSFSLIIQARPTARWKDANSPEFDPNWIVQFCLPQQAPKRESARLPICEDCISDRAAKRPLRESCSCRKPVIEWAEAKLRTLAGLWHRGRIEEMEKILRPKPVMLFKVVFETYARCGPKDADDRLSSLRLLLEGPSGRNADTIRVDELDANWARRFAALYQEYGRRGWSVRGQAPKDAWAQLRALKPLPAVDWENQARWNTTIVSAIRFAKSVLGRKSRDQFLHEIAPDMPKLEDFLQMTLGLPLVDTRGALSSTEYNTILEALLKVREVNLRLWMILEMCRQTGLRPIELRAARTTWLEVDAAQTVYLIVRNRPEDGFRLKDKESRAVRSFPLSTQLVEAIQTVTKDCESQSLWGLKNKTRVMALIREASDWVRPFVGDGPHTLYLLGRKTVATAQARTHGLEAARETLGHAKGSNTTIDYYVEPISQSKALSDDQVRAALTKPRMPWAPAKA